MASKRTRSARAARKHPQTAEEYLAEIPQPARVRIMRLREAILSVVPSDSTEVISYGIPAFKRGKVLVWYAAFANHCSLFPTASVIEAFKGELKGWTTSRG